MKIDHLITLSILLLLSLCNVRAQITEVANVTFQVAYLCEQPFDYNQDFEWDLPYGKTLCEHKNLTNENISKAILSAINNSKNVSIYYRDKPEGVSPPVPCPNVKYLSSRTPDFNITYDGTWLTFERFIARSMNLSEYRKEREESSKNKINTAFGDFKYALTINCRGNPTVNTIHIKSLRISDKSFQDLNKSDSESLCQTTQRKFSNNNLILFYNDFNGNVNSFEQEICVLYDNQENTGVDYSQWFLRAYLQERDIINLYPSEFYYDINGVHWKLTENVSSLKKDLQRNYDEVNQNQTLDNL
jgi:hypothetical protein